MGCCGNKNIKRITHKAGNIAQGFGSLAVGKKYKFTDKRVRICQTCADNEWKLRKLFCKHCGCFIPAKARVENEKCPLGKW